MTLTFKNISRNGKNAFYTGAKTPIRIPLTAFPDKVHPASFDVADGVFAAASTPKAKLTKEERAALPKPTLAEKIAKREAALAALKAKASAQEAATNQASL